MTAAPPCPFSTPDRLRPARVLLWWVWGAALILAVVMVTGTLLLVRTVHDSEQALALAEARLSTDAFTDHAIDVLDHTDALLYALRWVWQYTGSLAATEDFIRGFSFSNGAIANLYLIGADGTVLISHDPQGRHLSVADRAYFRFHREHPEDRLYIAPVERGRYTGAWHFRVTRRLQGPDGGFGGLVLATLDPEAFARRFASLDIGTEHVASLLGIEDHRLRARWPAPAPDKWAEPVETALWSHVTASPSGVFRGVSPVDGIQRLFSFRRVGAHPLVMVVGFSERDVMDRVWARVGWVLPVVPVSVALLLGLALLATSLVRSRSALTRANSALESLALRDALTGLPSRVLLTDRLETCLAPDRRSGKRCGLFYLDLDGFKAINDQDGHDLGDLVLRLVATRLVGALRAGDTVCRWGGDEFLILLPDADSSEELMAAAERLLEALAEPLPTPVGERHITASIGVAAFPDHGETAAALRAAADAALLKAKRAGKRHAVLAGVFC